MKKSMFLTVLLGLFFASTAFALEPGDTLWTRTYGGSYVDAADDVQQTSDGGYILAGFTQFGFGWYTDFYLVKTDANGDTLWTRTYGGDDWDIAKSVRQTSDGGYIVAGMTRSFGAGYYDAYLVKTDANGDTLWTRAYGGSDYDYANSVQQTTDGGYIVGGETSSFGVRGRDGWLLKLDANGDTLWTRTFDAVERESFRCVEQTTDGGYIVVGETGFWGGDVDFYLVKTDANGNTLWTRTYGGGEWDEGTSVQQTTDGGYIVVGSTESFSGGWDTDFYLLKTDANGDTAWARTYGGRDEEYGSSVKQTNDGGYILAGKSNSFWEGDWNFYVVKTDANGDTLWTGVYGGRFTDWAHSIQQTDDGNYVIAGRTDPGTGFQDMYLIKVAGGEQPAVSIELVPDQSPVVVPRGGSFGFTGTVTNNTDQFQQVDIWLMAYVPGIGMYGPLKRFNSVPFNPHQVRSAHLNQSIPNKAPISDQYIYYGYVGDYPSTKIDSSYFPFEVTAKELAKAGSGDWLLTGSFLEGELLDLPSEFALLSNYPNPFNAQTVIEYQLPVTSSVKLEVYNLLGEKVVTLVNGEQEAGYKSVTWDASEVSSGIYFYKLTAGDYTETMRMILVK